MLFEFRFQGSAFKPRYLSHGTGRKAARIERGREVQTSQARKRCLRGRLDLCLRGRGWSGAGG